MTTDDTITIRTATEDDWDAVMNVHLKGAFLMSKAAQKTFVAQKYGKILNLSSVSAGGKVDAANLQLTGRIPNSP